MLKVKAGIEDRDAHAATAEAAREGAGGAEAPARLRRVAKRLAADWRGQSLRTNVALVFDERAGARTQRARLVGIRMQPCRYEALEQDCLTRRGTRMPHRSLGVTRAADLETLRS